MDKTFAEHFAADWIASWNAHDLERILSHYAEDFEMSSPVIVQVAGEPSGTLRGKVPLARIGRMMQAGVPEAQNGLFAARELFAEHAGRRLT